MRARIHYYLILEITSKNEPLIIQPRGLADLNIKLAQRDSSFYIITDILIIGAAPRLHYKWLIFAGDF